MQTLAIFSLAPPFTRPKARRRGFSFIEVLFAVILLGIGFIMIAGIFPATISQSAATSNETQGALVARGALDQIRSVAAIPVSANADVQIFPPTNNGDIQTFTPTQTSAIMQGASFSADPRYGWIGFYSRDASMPFALFTVVALFNQDFPKYNGILPIFPTSDVSTTPPPYSAVFTVRSDPADNSKIIVQPPGGDPAPYAAVAGAFVIIQDALTSGVYSPLNGRVLRLGNDLGAYPPGSGTPAAFEEFYLQPGYDLSPGESIPTGATAYIIGRAPVFTGVPFTPASAVYTGPNQDIAVMSEYLPINDSHN
ncbi:MAG: prepilin-type N-terminal cleavage/methylation domain-containing protein [Planctomycetota bacterium]|nr:prepilin-type N-terminal cleavage/methylation domain-containing protein [Planctomycetota bacterium]